MTPTAILLGGLLAAASPAPATVQAWPDVEIAEADPREALRQAEAGVAQARAAGDKRRQLEALRRQSLAFAWLGEFKAQRETFERGLALAREVDEPEALTWFMESIAWLRFSEDRLDEAMTLLDEAAALAERRSPLRLPWIYLAKGDMLSFTGRTADAMTWLPLAYATFEARRDRYGMARTLMVIGSQVRSRPDADAEDKAQGLEDLTRARDLLDPRYRTARSQIQSLLGAAYYRLKDYARARPLLEEALATHQALGRSVSAAVSQCRLGLVDKDEGRTADALANLEAALPGLQRLLHATLYVECLTARAEVLGQLGRRREALRELANVAAELKRIDNPQLDVGYYSRVAVIYAAQEDFREAYHAMVALAAANRRLSETANRRLTAELEARFGTRLKEAENARLVAEQKESEATALVVFLLFGTAFVLLAGLALNTRRRAAHHRTLAQVADVGHAIASTQADEAVFESLHRNIGQLLRLESMEVWLLADGHLRRRFAMPSARSGQPDSISLSDPEAPAAACARERRDLISGRVIYAPLAAGGNLIGVLAVASGTKVEDRTRNVVRTLAAYGGVALANIASTERLQSANVTLSALSLTDSLTGLYNRRGLLLLAQQQLNDCARSGRGFALVFVDMDGMKKINDTHGHSEGDRALIDTAMLLRETFRQSDILARLGGDEFAVFMTDDSPATAEAGTAAMCDRLEEAVQRHNSTGGRPYTLSLSLGVSRDEASAPQSIETLIASADKKMFARKREKGATRV